MPPAIQSQAQFQNIFTTAYAAALAPLGLVPNLNAGSVVRAVGQASSSQNMINQLLGQLIINFARSSTATGADLDSFYAQFNFPREEAKFAFGTVTLSTPTANGQAAYITPGMIIQSSQSQIQYQVIADPLQASFNTSLQAYVLPANSLTVNVTAEALISGTGSNVQAGVLNQIVTQTFGVSVATNPLAIINGANVQTDAQYRTAFIAYINNLSKGTVQAITLAAQQLGTNYKVTLIENVQLVGSAPPTGIIGPNSTTNGNIVLLIDDGSGAPSAALITAATAAVDATRAAGIRRTVSGPAIIVPTIALNYRLGPNAVQATVSLAIQQAIVAYVNALPIGGLIVLNAPGTLYLSEIYQLALATTGVAAVEPVSVTINAAQSDLIFAAYQEALITTTNVTIGTY